ncbi:hypothetical protein ACS0TY_004826 [Phlomoides rotata]
MGNHPNLKSSPIVGMGGIGKTTLARYAYDDPLVMEYFDIRAFIQYPKIKVYQSLKGMRYLIVMDDIWSTEAWDDVRNIFPDDNNGSRIITTRLTDVAAYACCGSPLHEMKFMDGHQSWNLLKQKVFIDGQDCPPKLEDIGKEIARDVDGQLDRILSLSYTHLPYYLRPCFLFFGGFPEDHNIHVWRLIRLCVAEGFLKHQNRCKSLEEEAEEYLEDLVKRSLVLITSRKSDGKIKSCSLHDLVRDMCIRKAEEEKFISNGWACSFRKGRTQAPD